MLAKISTIEQLESWLHRTPAMLEIQDKLTLAFLSESPKLFDKCINMISWLDQPKVIKEEMVVCLSHDVHYAHRFPLLNCIHNPYTSELDRLLVERFHLVRQYMIKQDGIGDIVVSDCIRKEVETVVLILVDGLSYTDTDNWDEFSNKLACLVTGITTTRQGFRNVIGDPPLGLRLFELGFRNRIGYTYWTREGNELTDLLFRSIPSASIVEGNTMSKTLVDLAQPDLENTYVQIVRVGLDQYAHGERGEDIEDNREVTLQNIRRELIELKNILESKGRPALIYLTSDHGLLWRDQTQFDIIGNVAGSSSPRYCQVDKIGELDETKGRTIETTDQAYFQLHPNYLRRKLHRNEFGVHGGLSYTESVIPLIKIEVNINADDR